jgi:hypothetical protein
VDLGPEGLLQPEGVARVMTVAQDSVLGRAIAEQFQTLGREQRIKRHSLLAQVIRADLRTDIRVTRGPMPKAGGDLLHVV